MRNVILTAVAVSAMLAGPALAQERHLYVGGDLGLVLSADNEFAITPAATVGSTGQFDVETDMGFQGSIFVGYDFGLIRVEVEGTQAQADYDALTSDFALGGGLVNGSQSVDGDVRARAVMANVLADFGDYNGFSAFVGAGAGMAKVEISDLALSNGIVLLDDGGDSEWQSAWQVMAGVRRPLAENLELHLRYRYLRIEDSERVGYQGRVFDGGGLSAHTVAAGVTYRFW